LHLHWAGQNGGAPMQRWLSNKTWEKEAAL
jgi:hypothetical protein